jgi:hypothetical protein
MQMTLQQAIAAGIVFPASTMSGPTLDGGGVSFLLPLEIISEMNWRGHWAVKYRRAKNQKRTAYNGTMKHAHTIRYRFQAGEGIRLAVTLIRIMRPRQRRFDSDNLASGFKAIRDGVASALGIDDGDDRLEWHYAQETGSGAGCG